MSTRFHSNHKRPIILTIGAATIVGAVALVAQPVASVPDTTRMPFQVEYEWRGEDSTEDSTHIVTMESWSRWHYRQIGGAEDGYTVIADGTGRVVAGYPEWPADTWVELHPPGTEGIFRPRSWIRPYFFAADDPIEDLRIDASELDSDQARLGIAAADDLDGFDDPGGERVVFHVQTGVPLKIAYPSGFVLEAVRVEEVPDSLVAELIAPSQAVPHPGDAKGATPP